MATELNSAPFVILFQGRSGSTYLVEGLSSHPSISCEVEKLVGLRKFGGDAQLTWVDEYFGSMNPENRAIGFKTKLDDVINPAAFSTLLQSHKAKVILLTRRNLPKVVVSWMNSERIYAATGDWNLYPPAQPMTPFAIDPNVFERRLQLVSDGRDRLCTYVSRVRRPTLELLYEDILLDHAGTHRRIFDFLGVTDMTVAGNCLKATDDDLRNVILNFDELREKYRGSKYQSMIEEVLSR
jgi:hypothetical protein